MGDLFIVTGAPGAGKLRFAADLIGNVRPVVYLAAAHWADPEENRRMAWEEQIGWETVVEPIDVGGVIRREGNRARAIVVDRLSLVVVNWHEYADDPHARLDDLLAATREVAAQVYLITNETGDGPWPPSDLNLLHRDLLEACNQRVIRAATQVHLVVAGLPLRLKPWTAPVE
jgi:adenosylcobinamide kinase/adenosylcobinamide-phosphate guanylyltransferase